MDNRTDRQLAAIMFADIVSYSRMMGENEEETLKILAEFEKISIPIVEKFKGVLIKKNGDQIFCEFSSSKNAVDASLEIQNQLSTYNDSRPKDFKLEIRIGIHIGDVVKREDGDIHGDDVFAYDNNIEYQALLDKTHSLHTASENTRMTFIMPLGITVKIDEVFDSTGSATIYKKHDPFKVLKEGDILTRK